MPREVAAGAISTQGKKKKAMGGRGVASGRSVEPIKGRLAAAAAFSIAIKKRKTVVPDVACKEKGQQAHVWETLLASRAPLSCRTGECCLYPREEKGERGTLCHERADKGGAISGRRAAR